jgi:hemoglobin
LFGGPPRYTEELGGFPAVLRPHQGKQIAEEQRVRFVDALRGYLDFGTQVAVQNSFAQAEADLHPCQEVPHWSW